MISIQKLLDRVPGIEEAQAHCDIPCRIYDTGPALIAAVSVVRMMDIIHEVAAKADADPTSKYNTIARNIAMKEKEAEKVKQEVRIIWATTSRRRRSRSFRRSTILLTRSCWRAAPASRMSTAPTA